MSVTNGDLIWWREAGGFHTAVTLWPGIDDVGRFAPVTARQAPIDLRLFDAGGRLMRAWSDTVAAGVPFVIDSTRIGDSPADGVLAISASANARSAHPHLRLQSMVDWYSDRGDIVSLHSDQAVSDRTSPLEFTEIVFFESASSKNALVIVNGPRPQRPGALELAVRNHRGMTRRRAYPSPMAPFSLHRVGLGDVFAGLDAFCEGRHATLEGRFDAVCLFCRPYVTTDGEKFSAYHGGDRYVWPALPQFVYRALGRGETNPMVALHSNSLTTAVNLLNSHGDVEEDFWVDAKLYDCAGRLVIDRERWLLARRGGLARGEVAELVGGADFVGHVSLNFTASDRPFYPRRLQALLEYRTAATTARVMAWSDIWNARDVVRRVRDRLEGAFEVRRLYGDDYLEGAGVVHRCHYRAWCRPPLTSLVAITNCAAAQGYDRAIECTVRLFNVAGEQLSTSRSLAPHATACEPIERLFPSAQAFLLPTGVGVVTVESAADLAVMHLTSDERSGAVSAEHFLPSMNRRDGMLYACCGS